LIVLAETIRLGRNERQTGFSVSFVPQQDTETRLAEQRHVLEDNV